jgi:preprotein translocase subunit SecA
MEDNLMRIFGDPVKTKALLGRFGMKPGEVIESRMLTRQIEKAQRKVEAHNFDARKNLLEYDDVANDQRKVIYAQRTELMAAEDVADAIVGIREEVVNGLIDQFVPPGSVSEQWRVQELAQAIERDFLVRLDIQEWLNREVTLDEQGLRKRILDAIVAAYDAKVAQYGAELMRHVEKTVMLQQLDLHWREHLAAMDYMRQGIHLRGYAQKNPKQEYKREAFELFSAMLDRIKYDTVTMLSRVQLRSQEEIEREEQERQRRMARALQAQHAQAQSPVAAAEEEPQAPAQAGPVARRQVAPPQTPFVRDGRKVGRNEPCPCGSGKKFKHCHGALAANESR